MKRQFALSLGAAALATLMLQPAPASASPTVNAVDWDRVKEQARDDGRGPSDDRRDDTRDNERHGNRGDDRRDDDRAGHGWRGYDDRDDGHRHDRRDDDRRGYDRHDYDRRYYERHYWDRHDRHYYPRRGHVVSHLPRGYRVVHHHGDRYYYGDGAWYRPYGSRFVVVAPPIGLTLSFLPEFHTTLWFGGVPYYRANSVYFVWQPKQRAYVVTDGPW